MSSVYRVLILKPIFPREWSVHIYVDYVLITAVFLQSSIHFFHPCVQCFIRKKAFHYKRGIYHTNYPYNISKNAVRRQAGLKIIDPYLKNNEPGFVLRYVTDPVHNMLSPVTSYSPVHYFTTGKEFVEGYTFREACSDKYD